MEGVSLETAKHLIIDSKRFLLITIAIHNITKNVYNHFPTLRATQRRSCYSMYEILNDLQTTLTFEGLTQSLALLLELIFPLFHDGRSMERKPYAELT